MTNMKRMKISLVLPAHNEEGNIEKLTKQILKLCDKDVFEVIIVDDRSTDNTGKIAERLAKKYKKIKVIHREITSYNKNRVQVGFAIREGYKAAKGDQVMSIDSDFAMAPADVKRVIEKFKKGNCDMVIGSRFVKQSKLIKYPFDKWLANRAFHFVFRFLLGIKTKDLSNNFRIMKKEIAKKIEWKSEGFSILAEIGIMASIMNYKICEVPVIWKQRSFGKSKFKVLKIAPSYVKVALRAFYIKYFVRKSKELNRLKNLIK